jgi:hypothetical protein
METMHNQSEVLSVKDWVITLLVTAIPSAGINRLFDFYSFIALIFGVRMMSDLV